MTTNIVPREGCTEIYIGSDGSRVALCTGHVHKRRILSEIEYEPVAPGRNTLERLKTPCHETCVDCLERSQNLKLKSLVDHWADLQDNSTAIYYLIEDMVLTLEMSLEALEEDRHIKDVRTMQGSLKMLLPLFDNGLNQKWSHSARFSTMLDDDGSEARKERLAE